jgi:hypothetical protein
VHTKTLNQETQIIIRLSQELKNKIYEMAVLNSRSMNSEIIYRLQKIIADEETK